MTESVSLTYDGQGCFILTVPHRPAAKPGRVQLTEAEAYDLVDRFTAALPPKLSDTARAACEEAGYTGQPCVWVPGSQEAVAWARGRNDRIADGRA